MGVTPLKILGLRVVALSSCKRLFLSVHSSCSQDWSKCYNFNFDTRYGPGPKAPEFEFFFFVSMGIRKIGAGDLVHFNTSQGLEVGQVQDCDKVASTCRRVSRDEGEGLPFKHPSLPGSTGSRAPSHRRDRQRRGRLP